jgi:hypothetical protein
VEVFRNFLRCVDCDPPNVVVYKQPAQEILGAAEASVRCIGLMPERRGEVPLKQQNQLSHFRISVVCCLEDGTNCLFKVFWAPGLEKRGNRLCNSPLEVAPAHLSVPIFFIVLVSNRFKISSAITAEACTLDQVAAFVGDVREVTGAL